MLKLILACFAFVLFCLASGGINFPRLNLGWVGFALLTLIIILDGVHK